YELADDNRGGLIYEKGDLLAPLLPGMENPPHPMRLGDDERDYYLASGAWGGRASSAGSDGRTGTLQRCRPGSSRPSRSWAASGWCSAASPCTPRCGSR